MSYKDHIENIEGVRKVVWDDLWHIMYDGNGAIEPVIYDRITRKEAMYILKMLPKWRLAHTKHILSLNCV